LVQVCAICTSGRTGFEVTPIGANGFGRCDRRALARFGPNAIRRGDKKGIELVMAGLHGWEAALRRRLMTTS
jgi:hypothetical protein